MKKIILISAVTLFSTGAYSGECKDNSLKGQYGYEVSGVNLVPLPGTTPGIRSTHVVGQARFNGKGDFSIAGVGSAAGYVTGRTGSGLYTVDPETCTATGNVAWTIDGVLTGETSDVYIVLDQADGGHSDNRAYHASLLVTSKAPYSSSASGTLTRFVGKFN